MGEKLDKDGYEYLKIFVGGLSSSTDEDSLSKYFGQYGELKEARIVKKKDFKAESKGYGFVTFITEESYQKCLEEKSHIIDDKKVEVKKAEPARTSRSTWKTKKVFVGGLHDSTTKEDIEERLVDLGFKEELDEAKIMTEKDTEKPRGFAFVFMKSCEAADKLVRLGHITVKDRQVEVKHAIPKEEMQEKKRLSYDNHYSGRPDHYGRGSPEYYGRGDPYYARGPDPYYKQADYAFGRYPPSRGYYDDRPVPAYPSYDGGYASRYSGGYGGVYGSYGSYGYGSPAASSMGSYSQSASSYGPTRGREKSYDYHPYSRR